MAAARMAANSTSTRMPPTIFLASRGTCSVLQTVEAFSM
eukprot:CAMPEP_0115870276 /NCGR_PEP_ID=MMETSP0287-20121206/22240_1 /TAXON_ID=412157 /ORGANISM="Chrysochromulina rotalis, Strain UIO044" /LENGTH=38 /DNA_ID= /DNA_START= /DNA_END= /DNA_ORIENTATION=